MTIVAVVRPFRLNHLSEYIGPSTWNTGCAIPAKNYSSSDSDMCEHQGEAPNLAKDEESIRGLWG